MPFVLYLLAVAVFAMGTSEFMLGGLVPVIADSLGVSVSTAGLLTSAFAVGMLVGAPAMAILARRWSPRASLLVFLLLFSAMHVVGALTTSFGTLLATRVIAALANAGFLAVALSVVGTLVGTEATGRALAVLLSGTTLATIAGVPAGALLGRLFDWRATFWAVALLCVPAAFGVVRGLASTTESTARSGAGHRLRAELAQLAAPRLLLVMLLGALVNAGTFAAFTFLAPVVTDVAGLDDFWVPAALVLFGVGSFVGVTIAGRLSDRRPDIAISVGGPLLTVGWLVMAATAHQPVILLTSMLVQGALAFGVGSTFIARILHEAAGAPTMAGAYATAALNVGAAAGPALAALTISTRAGDLGPVWVGAALAAAATVVAVPLRRVLAPRLEAIAPGSDRLG